MHSVGKTGANNPGHLFGQVCRRSPQFRGFQQQDAHELLRHLMDSLRTEEVKRQKTAILKQFGLSEKTDPKTVSAIIKKKLQVRLFNKRKKMKGKDLRRQPGFDPITFTFSENSNYWLESLLEITRQNVAG